jgi:hypothetical protein
MSLFPGLCSCSQSVGFLAKNYDQRMGRSSMQDLDAVRRLPRFPCSRRPFGLDAVSSSHPV